MNKAESNNIWDSFTDKLNREKFITEGVAFLERWYEKDGDIIRHHLKNTDDDDTVIPLPLVAKGISAYLSYWPYSDYKSLRILLREKNSIDTDEIFTRYFENCYRFLDYSNRKIALPHKRKSKSDLILEHLKIEEQDLFESEPLFFECKPWEKDTISEIKEVALFYPVWVKKTHLNNTIQNIAPESTRPPKKLIPVLPFPDLFIQSKEKIGGICETVFNKNQSPKDYAIMLCLLSQGGFITTGNKQRKAFYKSWYNYIGRPFPKDCNFYPINKYIADKAANGFYFNDEEDMDYLNLKDAFDKALKKNKL
ncbi:MAG TPA: hypothetical protein VGK10_15500 [Prolixibacteraceae bacterium]|jgi:hypothetical protein